MAGIGERGEVNGVFRHQSGGLLLLLRRQGAAQVAHVLADMVAIEQRGLGHENPVDIVAD
jgi:hypothetical protein